MKINSINYNENNSPAFKSVGIHSVVVKRNGVTRVTPHLYIKISNDTRRSAVKDKISPGEGLVIGSSGIASTLSVMAFKFGEKIAGNDFSKQVRMTLRKLREDNRVAWDLLRKNDLKKIDSIIKRGEIIQINRNSFAIAVTQKAIKFLKGIN